MKQLQGVIYTFVELKQPFKAAAKYLQVEKATLADIKSKDLICLLRILASSKHGHLPFYYYLSIYLECLNLFKVKSSGWKVGEHIFSYA